MGAVGWERVPTPFCTSNITWRFRFFISISTRSAWSSINQWSSTWAKLPPRGRFYALWGRFC